MTEVVMFPKILLSRVIDRLQQFELGFSFGNLESRIGLHLIAF